MDEELDVAAITDLLGDSSIPSLEVSRRLEAVAARLKHLSPEQLDQVFDQDNEEAMRALTEAFNLRINTMASDPEDGQNADLQAVVLTNMLSILPPGITGQLARSFIESDIHGCLVEVLGGLFEGKDELETIQARQKLVALIFQTFYDLSDAEWLASPQDRKPQAGRDHIAPVCLKSLLTLLPQTSALAVNVKRTGAAALLNLVCRSRGVQKHLVDHLDLCIPVYTQFLPTCGDYITQLDLMEALYRCAKHAADPDAVMDACISTQQARVQFDAVLRKSSKEVDLSSDLRTVLMIINSNMTLPTVHCLEAFSISVSPEGVARPASNWVDIGIRRVTLHLLLGSEQGGGDEGGDTLPEDVDLELDNIGEVVQSDEMGETGQTVTVVALKLVKPPKGLESALSAGDGAMGRCMSVTIKLAQADAGPLLRLALPKFQMTSGSQEQRFLEFSQPAQRLKQKMSRGKPVAYNTLPEPSASGHAHWHPHPSGPPGHVSVPPPASVPPTGGAGAPSPLPPPGTSNQVLTTPQLVTPAGTAPDAAKPPPPQTQAQAASLKPSRGDGEAAGADAIAAGATGVQDGTQDRRGPSKQLRSQPAAHASDDVPAGTAPANGGKPAATTQPEARPPAATQAKGSSRKGKGAKPEAAQEGTAAGETDTEAPQDLHQQDQDTHVASRQVSKGPKATDSAEPGNVSTKAAPAATQNGNTKGSAAPAKGGRRAKLESDGPSVKGVSDKAPPSSSVPPSNGNGLSINSTESPDVMEATEPSTRRTRSSGGAAAAKAPAPSLPAKKRGAGTQPTPAELGASPGKKARTQPTRAEARSPPKQQATKQDQAKKPPVSKPSPGSKKKGTQPTQQAKRKSQDKGKSQVQEAAATPPPPSAAVAVSKEQEGKKRGKGTAGQEGAAPAIPLVEAGSPGDPDWLKDAATKAKPATQAPAGRAPSPSPEPSAQRAAPTKSPLHHPPLSPLSDPGKVFRSRRAEVGGAGAPPGKAKEAPASAADKKGSDAPAGGSKKGAAAAGREEGKAKPRGGSSVYDLIDEDEEEMQQHEEEQHERGRPLTRAPPAQPSKSPQPAAKATAAGTGSRTTSAAAASPLPFGKSQGGAGGRGTPGRGRLAGLGAAQATPGSSRKPLTQPQPSQALLPPSAPRPGAQQGRSQQSQQRGKQQAATSDGRKQASKTATRPASAGHAAAAEEPAEDTAPAAAASDAPAAVIARAPGPVPSALAAGSAISDTTAAGQQGNMPAAGAPAVTSPAHLDATGAGGAPRPGKPPRPGQRPAPSTTPAVPAVPADGAAAAAGGARSGGAAAVLAGVGAIGGSKQRNSGGGKQRASGAGSRSRPAAAGVIYSDAGGAAGKARSGGAAATTGAKLKPPAFYEAGSLDDIEDPDLSLRGLMIAAPQHSLDVIEDDALPGARKAAAAKDHAPQPAAAKQPASRAAGSKRPSGGAAAPAAEAEEEAPAGKRAKRAASKKAEAAIRDQAHLESDKTGTARPSGKAGGATAAGAVAAQLPSAAAQKTTPATATGAASLSLPDDQGLGTVVAGTVVPTAEQQQVDEWEFELGLFEAANQQQTKAGEGGSKAPATKAAAPAAAALHAAAGTTAAELRRQFAAIDEEDMAEEAEGEGGSPPDAAGKRAEEAAAAAVAQMLGGTGDVRGEDGVVDQQQQQLTVEDEDLQDLRAASPPNSPAAPAPPPRPAPKQAGDSKKKAVTIAADKAPAAKPKEDARAGQKKKAGAAPLQFAVPAGGVQRNAPGGSEFEQPGKAARPAKKQLATAAKQGKPPAPPPSLATEDALDLDMDLRLDLGLPSVGADAQPDSVAGLGADQGEHGGLLDSPQDQDLLGDWEEEGLGGMGGALGLTLGAKHRGGAAAAGAANGDDLFEDRALPALRFDLPALGAKPAAKAAASKAATAAGGKGGARAAGTKRKAAGGGTDLLGAGLDNGPMGGPGFGLGLGDEAGGGSDSQEQGAALLGALVKALGDDEGEEDEEQMTAMAAAVAGMLKRKRQKAQERQAAIMRAARDKVAQDAATLQASLTKEAQEYAGLVRTHMSKLNNSLESKFNNIQAMHASFTEQLASAWDRYSEEYQQVAQVRAQVTQLHARLAANAKRKMAALAASAEQTLKEAAAQAEAEAKTTRRMPGLTQLLAQMM